MCVTIIKQSEISVFSNKAYQCLSKVKLYGRIGHNQDDDLQKRRICVYKKSCLSYAYKCNIIKERKLYGTIYGERI